VNFYYASDVAYYLAAVSSTPSLSYWQDRFAPQLQLTVADTPTPEPATAAAALLGLTVIVVFARRR
jgi:uncharacterized protein (TIGR03382 family)